MGGRELINVIVINLWLVLISIQYSRNVPDKCYCNKLMASPHIKQYSRLYYIESSTFHCMVQCF